MASVFSDLLRGVSQASNQFPQAMQNRFAMQQQQEAELNRQAQQRLQNMLSGVKSGLEPPPGAIADLTAAFGTPRAGKTFMDVVGPQVPQAPRPMETKTPGVFQNYDPAANTWSLGESDYYIEPEPEPLFTPWQFDTDKTTAVRQDKNGGIYFRYFDKPQSPEDMQEEASAKNELIQLHRKELNKRMPDQILEELKNDADRLNMEFDAEEWSTIENEFAVRALEVDDVMTVTQKNKTWVMGTVANLAAEALAIMETVPNLEEELGRIGGNKALLQDWLLGGEETPEPLKKLMNKLNLALEVFARNQTGAQIKDEEMASFYNLVGRINLSEESLAVQLPGLIDLANTMVSGAYDQALMAKGQPFESLDQYRGKYPSYKSPPYVVRAKRARFQELSKKAKASGGVLEDEEAEEYNNLVEILTAAGILKTAVEIP